MQNWAQKKLCELAEEGICGFVFKGGSPSSGMRAVKIYTPAGEVSGAGAGIFAAAFMKRYPLLPVEEDERLQNLPQCENFFERASAYAVLLKRLEESDNISCSVETRLTIPPVSSR